MKHSVPHDLGLERAKQAAEKALASYQQKFQNYNPTATWTSESRAEIAFKIKGMNLTGALEVKERSIDMELDVPFLLRPFQGQAVSVIEGEIKDWLSKAKAGQL
jgi:hypothetical protein